MPLYRFSPISEWNLREKHIRALSIITEYHLIHQSALMSQRNWTDRYRWGSCTHHDTTLTGTHRGSSLHDSEKMKQSDADEMHPIRMTSSRTKFSRVSRDYLSIILELDYHLSAPNSMTSTFTLLTKDMHDDCQSIVEYNPGKDHSFIILASLIAT